MTFVSSPTKKKRDLTTVAATTATASSTTVATKTSSSSSAAAIAAQIHVLPRASAGAAIPNDAITKDDTIETDERSSTTSQAIQSNSKTRSSKSFFKRKDKSSKQRSNANRNSNNTSNCNEAHGFISSFNQIKSSQITANNLPVITSATTTAMLHRNNVAGGGGGGNGNFNTNTNKITKITDDFINDYSMEQILNKKIARDEPNKYSKRNFHLFYK